MRGWSPWSPRWPRLRRWGGSRSRRSPTSSRRPISCWSPAMPSVELRASWSARSFGRFAARLHVEWRAPRGAVAGVIAALILGGWLASQPGAGGGPGGSRGAGPGEALAATTPTGYLLGVQNTEGGYGPAPGASSSQLFSGWAALALEAEG